ncbi:hypothetical protein MUN78_10285 [Leucobacter allii]|uniref:Uncharacterized protein n=1 Tax=Leucobacter allii TaxID=2932247 RepID=A0ABY4FHE6_9MICO|nr:hypothetical protein [Leucobacter allii]UOQ56091.1 hypothetical protein MUN78_10285 [Leucobacter allii]
MKDQDEKADSWEEFVGPRVVTSLADLAQRQERPTTDAELEAMLRESDRAFRALKEQCAAVDSELIELRREVERQRAQNIRAGADVLEAEAKLAKVRELHPPVECDKHEGCQPSCDICLDSWPCPTVQALAGEDV